MFEDNRFATTEGITRRIDYSLIRLKNQRCRVLYKVEDIATCLVEYVKFWEDWEVDRYGNANLVLIRASRLKKIPLEVMAELISEEYIVNDQNESNFSITSNNINIEFSDEFLVELRKSVYHGWIDEDVMDHIAKVLEMIDLSTFPGLDFRHQLTNEIFPLSLADDAKQWWINKEGGKIIVWEELVRNFSINFILNHTMEKKKCWGEETTGVPIQEELTALRFRVDVAESDNASLRATIRTMEVVETVTRNHETLTRIHIERMLASVQESHRQDREDFKKLKELVTS
ncbi:hypothetical protein Tco_1104342 [Tanacetum coccineum]